MPLVAKEVIIKVTVQESPEKGGDSSVEEGGDAPKSNNKDIIATCVDQVLEILKEKSEP